MADGPDQGYAWVVAMACFFINFILVGLARSVGVLYVAVIHEYGVSRLQATTPFSIRASVRNLSGPLIGLLGQKFGSRPVVTVGGVVAATGCILTFFAPNITWVTICWGLVHGIGFGLSTVLHMMMIGKYFDKYKASALGLGFSGDCFGTFAFPVIIETLLEHYGLRSTFLILGGVVLNVVPMALLLKEPPWIEGQSTLRKNAMQQETTITDKTVKDTYVKADQLDESYSAYADRGLVTVFETDENSSSADEPSAGYSNLGFVSSDSDISSLSPSTETELSKNLKQLLQFRQQQRAERRTSQDGGFSPERQNSFLSSSGCSSIYLPDVPENGKSGDRPRNAANVKRSVSDLNDRRPPFAGGRRFRTDSLPPVLDPGRSGSLAAADVEHAAEVRNFPRRSSSFVGAVAQGIARRLRSASFASQAASDGYCAPLPQDPVEAEPVLDLRASTVELRERDPSVFGDRSGADAAPPVQHGPAERSSGAFRLMLRTNAKPVMMLISLSFAAYVFIFLGVLTIVVDYAKDAGVPDHDAKYLVIGFSATDLVGRLTFGQVLDRKLVQMKNFVTCTMVVMGTVVAAVPLNASYHYLMMCMCVYGFVQAGTAIMFPLLVNMYMDAHEESLAMGGLNFYGGLVMFLMAPMIGFFRDNTGSYNSVFYIIGGIVAVVGILWQFEPIILKYKHKRQKKKYSLDSMKARQKNADGITLRAFRN